MFIFAEVIKYLKILKNLLFAFFIFFPSTLLKAVEYEWTGAIILENNIMVLYQISFYEQNGKIQGYSITDAKGENETKAKIVGTYNKKTHELQFEEVELLYTKSSVSKSEFCMINATANVRKKAGKDILDGTFTSTYYQSGNDCFKGKLILTSNKTAYSLLAKYSGKIKKVTQSEKVKKDSSNVAILNELEKLPSINKVTEIKSGETKSIQWKSNSIVIEIWDDNFEDGDMIEISYNNNLILKNYVIKNARKKMQIVYNKNTKNTLRIKALSEGKTPPNSVKMVLIDNEKQYLLLSKLRTNEEAIIELK